MAPIVRLIQGTACLMIRFSNRGVPVPQSAMLHPFGNSMTANCWWVKIAHLAKVEKLEDSSHREARPALQRAKRIGADR
jgi:hypothetical protein